MATAVSKVCTARGSIPLLRCLGLCIRAKGLGFGVRGSGIRDQFFCFRVWRVWFKGLDSWMSLRQIKDENLVFDIHNKCLVHSLHIFCIVHTCIVRKTSAENLK